MSFSKYFFILIPLFLTGCLKSEENILEGRWEFEKVVTPDNRVVTDRDSSTFLHDKVYEFYPNNLYSFEAVDYSNGEGTLVVKKGAYNLEKEDDQLFLTLKEQQLDGVNIKKLQIVSLTESELVWQNERKNRYFFNKAEKSWYDNVEN